MLWAEKSNLNPEHMSVPVNMHYSLFQAERSNIFNWLPNGCLVSYRDGAILGELVLVSLAD